MAFELPLARPYVEAEGDATVVYFTGRNVSLDEHSLRRNRDFLFALAERLDRTRLILDFTNVDHVSSLAQGTLVSLHWKLQTRGRHLILRNLGRELYRVFTAAQLNAFLELRMAWSASGARTAPVPKGAEANTSTNRMIDLGSLWSGGTRLVLVAVRSFVGTVLVLAAAGAILALCSFLILKDTPAYAR